MTATSTVRLDVKRMEALRAELNKFRTARVRVGILGGGVRPLDPSGDRHAKTGLRKRLGSISRTDSTGAPEELNNPTLGLWHEFGTKAKEIITPSGKTRTLPALPARSFLRMPLMTRMQTRIDEIGRETFRALIMGRGVIAALGVLGTVARNLIDKAFETGGWGAWPKLSPRTIKAKGSSAILIDSAQLRKSVTYDVARTAHA
jgi:hypothetical protein